MLTIKMTKSYTTISGDTYQEGEVYQLRSRTASELIENGAAESLDFKGR